MLIEHGSVSSLQDNGRRKSCLFPQVGFMEGHLLPLLTKTVEAGRGEEVRLAVPQLQTSQLPADSIGIDVSGRTLPT